MNKNKLEYGLMDIIMTVGGTLVQYTGFDSLDVFVTNVHGYEFEITENAVQRKATAEELKWFSANAEYEAPFTNEDWLEGPKSDKIENKLILEPMNRKLAKISSASLEIQERGILNFWIHVDYEEGMSQGIGGIVLDSYDKAKDRRIGTAYGCEIIRRLLLMFNVNDFSEMKGKMVWVLGEGEGFSFTTKGVQALKVDSKNEESLIFGDVAKEFLEITEL